MIPDNEEEFAAACGFDGPWGDPSNNEVDMGNPSRVLSALSLFFSMGSFAGGYGQAIFSAGYQQRMLGGFLLDVRNIKGSIWSGVQDMALKDIAMGSKAMSTGAKLMGVDRASAYLGIGVSVAQIGYDLAINDLRAAQRDATIAAWSTAGSVAFATLATALIDGGTLGAATPGTGLYFGGGAFVGNMLGSALGGLCFDLFNK